MALFHLQRHYRKNRHLASQNRLSTNYRGHKHQHWKRGRTRGNVIYIWYPLLISKRIFGIYFCFRFGIKGPTPLLQLPGFDIIWGMLPEYMHNTCLGVVRDLVEMTFQADGGAYKKRRHNNPMISAEVFNRAMVSTRVPSEFQRATRALSQGSWKAEEYRNTILFYFIAINR